MIEILMEQNISNHSLKQVAQDGSPVEPLLSNTIASELVQLFKLLSDETRLRILFALMQEDEMHVRALCELLDQSQPAVSHHLALLRVSGLIDRRREGKHNFYHLVSKKFEELLSQLFAGIAPGERQLKFKQFVFTRQSA
jgi:ArsR family transcriptional regulator